MVSILGVEAGVVHQVDAATDHIAGRERRPVRLSGARRAERVAVVAVVAVRVFVPTWKICFVIDLSQKFSVRTLYIFLPHPAPYIL